MLARLGSADWSLPVWEEWIEILCFHGINPTLWSLPVWEEWIEIYATPSRHYACLSLPVWEEWIEISSPAYSARSRWVSSRMGRVD